MGDIDERDAGGLLDAFQLDLHVLAQAQIQRCQRFVQQQHLRLVDQCPGDGNTLLLAAGQTVHAAVFVALQADDFQHFIDPAVNFVLGQLCYLQAESDVVVHIQMRKKGITLEHGVDLPLVGRNVVDDLPVKRHRAGSRRQKAADDPKRCGLAAAGGAEQCEEFVIVEIKIDAVENTLPVELHGQVLESDEFLGHYPPPFLPRFCFTPKYDRYYYTVNFCNVNGLYPFFPGKVSFSVPADENRAAAELTFAAARYLGRACYAAGAVTAVVSGMVSPAVSSGTVLGT